jgi:protein-disulfide isomerase
MNKVTWVILAIVALVFGGLVWLMITSDKGKISVDDINAAAVVAAEEQSGGIADHVRGNAGAKVVVVEYGDFQCPGCSTAASRMKAIVEEYIDRIAFVFRNYPVPSSHPNAKAAAAAAEAAGLQGGYWEMHDILFKNQATWSNSDIDGRTNVFVGFAESLELDSQIFKADLAAENITKKINFDLALGQKQGVTGTPSFFVDGEAVASDVWGDDEKFKALLDEKLAGA